MPAQKRTQALHNHSTGDCHLRARAGSARTLLWAPALAAILVIALPPRMWARKKPAAGLTATVDARTGDYAVTGRAPGWQFRGSVGSPLQDLVRTTGRDPLGPFHSVRFNWRWNDVLLTGLIKIYDSRPIGRFQLTYDDSTPHPQLNFPNFTSLPTDLHVFSYRNYMFAPPQFAAGDYGTPWLLFDDHFDAAIISPTAGFQVAVLSGDGQTTAGVSLAGC
jgi:hypothetical protein